jgi:hypothetical protein
MAMENLPIAQHRDTLRYAHTRGGSYKPKVRRFNVGDFVYLQRQPDDTLNISSGCTILKIKAIGLSGVLELQGANRCTIQDHSKNCAPCHVPNLDPTIITSTWIAPLVIHVRYVRGQMMLIRCYFAITVMVDTISSTLSRSSLEFLLATSTVHHVLL